LDEINRGHPDVLQAIFQLVLDRKIFTHELSESVGIVCAGNYSDDDYQVTELDPALMDRFLHLNLVFNKDSWLDWAEQNSIGHKIRGFVKDNHMKTEGKKCYYGINYHTKIFRIIAQNLEEQTNPVY